MARIRTDDDRYQPGISRPLAYRHAGSPLLGAILAGLVAGAVLLVLALIGWGLSGQPILTPLRLATATFFPTWGSTLGLAQALVGLAIHAVFSAWWGFIYGALIEQSSDRAALGWGLVFGIAVGLLMRFAVVTVIGSGAFVGVATLPFLAAHAIFGLSLATYRVFSRSLDQRRLSPEGFVPAHRQAAA